MNTRKRLGIWISDQKDIDKIPYIKQHLGGFADIFLITDQFIYSTDYAVIHYFYVVFENIDIVFLSVDDLLENKDKLRSNSLFLFCESNDVSKLNKNIVSNIKVITYELQ